MSTPSWLKALDFTNPNAALGGVTRQAIGSVRGGSQVLGAIDSFNEARRPTDRSGSGGAPDEAPASGGWRALLTGPTVIIGAGLVAALAVVFLVFRRK